MIVKLTPFEKYIIAAPIGMNAIPTTKNVGNTVPAVRIGCHAGNFCCLKALSAIGLRSNYDPSVNITLMREHRR